MFRGLALNWGLAPLTYWGKMSRKTGKNVLILVCLILVHLTCRSLIYPIWMRLLFSGVLGYCEGWVLAKILGPHIIRMWAGHKPRCRCLTCKPIKAQKVSIDPSIGNALESLYPKPDPFTFRSLGVGNKFYASNETDFLGPLIFLYVDKTSVGSLKLWFVEDFEDHHDMGFLEVDKWFIQPA